MTVHPDPIRFEFRKDGIHVDASVIADGLGLQASRLPALLRSGEITSICEHGLDVDEGRYRLTFFHRSKRLRLVVDTGGRLIRRSTIDFGDRPMPTRLREAGP